MIRVYVVHDIFDVSPRGEAIKFVPVDRHTSLASVPDKNTLKLGSKSLNDFLEYRILGGPLDARNQDQNRPGVRRFLDVPIQGDSRIVAQADFLSEIAELKEHTVHGSVNRENDKLHK